MGWCHEFGPQIADSCEHPMTAHTDHCECIKCGTVCQGRFAGCGAVWARGPREVAVNAPHLGRAERSDALPPTESDRWRLPLEAAASDTRPSFTFPDFEEVVPEPVVIAEVVVEAQPEPEPEPEPVAPRTPVLEPPDVTTRFAVAQLELLNDRVAGLTGETLARTEAALEKVAAELEQLRTQREIDYTEQAAGIFTAVQTGADALAEFSKTVAEVTEYLRAVLTDSLNAIGGTEGLASMVASSSAELTETREEFAASLGRIERDMTLLRRRANAEAKEAKKAAAPAKLDDEQVTLIVDAVTDAVLSALEQASTRKRR